MDMIGSSKPLNNMEIPAPKNQKEGQAENPATPTDEVVVSKPEESLAKKIIHFPAKVIGAVAGGVMSVPSAALHVVPGAVKGIQEGISPSETGYSKKGLFYAALWMQNLAIGAGAGFMTGGPIGAAIGAAGAAVFTAMTNFVGERSDAYDNMAKKVEEKVAKAISDNQGSKMKVLVQNATEGAIIGGGAAAKSGLKVGYDAGDGVVSGVFGAGEGLVEGLYEAAKSLIKDAKK